jgi:hypothetical protein
VILSTVEKETRGCGWAWVAGEETLGAFFFRYGFQRDPFTFWQLKAAAIAVRALRIGVFRSGTIAKVSGTLTPPSVRR